MAAPSRRSGSDDNPRADAKRTKTIAPGALKSRTVDRADYEHNKTTQTDVSLTARARLRYR